MAVKWTQKPLSDNKLSVFFLRAVTSPNYICVTLPSQRENRDLCWVTLKHEGSQPGEWHRCCDSHGAARPQLAAWQHLTDSSRVRKPRWINTAKGLTFPVKRESNSGWKGSPSASHGGCISQRTQTHNHAAKKIQRLRPKHDENGTKHPLRHIQTNCEPKGEASTNCVHIF